MYELRFSHVIKRPRCEVFAFFSDISNLEKLTPSWLHFKILTPLPFLITPGSLIDYRLRLCGIPFYWQTEIKEYKPDDFFVDTARRGPFRHWYHEHHFSDTAEGTLMEDHVFYRPWGGALANRLFVRRSLNKVFSFRSKVLSTLLDENPPQSSRKDHLA